MAECDTITMDIPEGDLDVQISTVTCGFEGVDEVAPGQTVQATVAFNNDGADTGSADIKVKAIPEGMNPEDNPEEVAVVGTERVVIPGFSSDVAIFDVEIPNIEAKDWRIFATAENQAGGTV